MEQRKKELNDILLEYSPDKQVYFASNKELRISNIIPKLKDLNVKYGDLACAIWINPQLANLAVFCNMSSLLNSHTIREFANMVSRRYGNLRLSELMAFFYKCKCGDYGKLFSLMDIMVALKKYDKDRVEDLGSLTIDEKHIDDNYKPVAWNDIKDKFNINTKQDED